MPYDLEAVERGYGECEAEYNGHKITLRYRADLDGRAMHAMRRAMIGVPMLGSSGDRLPDTDQVMSELVRVLLPCSEEIPPEERGWDMTRGGKPIPITTDEMERLDYQLPVILLGAIMADLQDPNRRRPSRPGSSAGAASEPIAFPTSTGSSTTPNGQDSPSTSSPASMTALGYGRVGGIG